MAIEVERTAIPADALLDELEQLRQEHLHGRLLRPPKNYKSKDEESADKRRKHLVCGGNNDKFEGERYLNCDDKRIRRIQLRKLIDEGGQQTVGVGLPSHPMLSRWESYEFGLGDEEIDRLEQDDMPAETFMWTVWRTGHHRNAHWAVSIGSSLVGEGEKRVPGMQEKLQANIKERRKQYISWDIDDVDRALANAIEHAGVDIEHSEFGVNVVKEFVTTPELQDELRRAFILTLHQNIS
jgi:pyrroloquinoline quinone (PQQ) biosynthesis protein C